LPPASSYSGVIVIFKFSSLNLGSSTNTMTINIYVPSGDKLDNVLNGTQSYNPNHTNGFYGKSILNVQSNGSSWWITSVSEY